MDIMTSTLMKVSYGLYAIGTMDNGRPTGCIVNTVMQVTSVNPIVAISMNKDNYTCSVIERTKEFSVNILSEQTGKEVITQLGFASGRDKNKFDELSYEVKGGLPVLGEKISAAFTCKVISMTETPTHIVILASVVEAFEGGGDPPMTYKYYHEVVKGSAPKNAPTYVAPEAAASVAAASVAAASVAAASGEIWTCDICGYVYHGDLTKEPDSFFCPICRADKTHFKRA